MQAMAENEFKATTDLDNACQTMHMQLVAPSMKELINPAMPGKFLKCIGQVQERKAALLASITSEVFGEAAAAEVGRIAELNREFTEGYTKDAGCCLKR